MYIFRHVALTFHSLYFVNLAAVGAAISFSLPELNRIVLLVLVEAFIILLGLLQFRAEK
jgi:uncharacterized membrane protein